MSTMPQPTYPHLLSPLTVRNLRLRNRMVMGAMHTRLETLDRPLERLAAFYAARPNGEIALILTGGYSPVHEGVMDEGGLVLNSVDQLDEHRKITGAVNQAGGRIALQILHQVLVDPNAIFKQDIIQVKSHVERDELAFGTLQAVEARIQVIDHPDQFPSMHDVLVKLQLLLISERLYRLYTQQGLEYLRDGRHRVYRQMQKFTGAKQGQDDG